MNQAVRRDPANARALFLRGRAKDAAGQPDAAIADYNLAARNALAKAEDQGSGEAHIYRGISLYRRKEYEPAEDEFTNALNFEISAVVARRCGRMAAARGGRGRQLRSRAAGTSRSRFRRPRRTSRSDEARKAIAACSATTTAARPSR